ncbi:MAG: alpha/beta hydrolase [Rhodococcus sp.]|nr:alpha/beta hydrolase [Rhodococcus sp. (in: high G+C Gram-positive bacteria)]
MPALHTYVFGPDLADADQSPGDPVVLALHGITGHGLRWRNWAQTYFPDTRVLAPDLLGHGRSSFLPPWNIEAHVDAIVDTLDEYAPGRPVIVVAHSFGAALALHTSRAIPDRIAGLVLLDPALGLPADALSEVADSTVASPDYTDEAEARSEKVHGAWADVPVEILDAEIAEHLVPLPNGRVNWRMSMPAIITVWGELARPFVVPGAVVPTVLVQAMKVQPPYVSPEFRSAMREFLGDQLTEIELDCDHMVLQERPADVAGYVRRLLG